MSQACRLRPRNLARQDSGRQRRVTTATTSVTTRMTLRVSTYPSKRLYRTMGYGV
jgi:hypothetical protein